MNEICEQECDLQCPCPDTLQPVIDLQPILDKLISANVSETEAKSLLRPVEEELKRRTCGLVWKWGGATADLLKSMGDRLPVFSRCPEMTIEADKGPDHVLIEGENLLTLLSMQYTHIGKDRHGLIDVIYIDPPYDTKSTTMTYNDRFETSEWLSMMDARLRLARNLLARKGVIFVSIDDRHQAELKLLMNDIFGSDNFIAQIVVASNSTKNNAKKVSVNHEYLLVYGKKVSGEDRWQVSKNYIGDYMAKTNQLVKKGLSKAEIERELKDLVKYPKYYDFDHYIYVDDRGIYMTADPGGVKNGNTESEIIHPITGKPCKKPSHGWRFSEQQIRQMVADDLFEFGEDENTVPRPKKYLSDYLTQVPKSTVFFDSQGTTKKLASWGLKFDFPKPVALIRHILSIFPNDCKVLDFFAGSGTTLHAVLELNAEDGGNRQCILCTNNELGKKAKEAAKKAGIDPAAPEAGQFGVCQAVTWPRIKAILTGQTPSGKSADTVYPDNSVFTYKINEEMTDLISGAQTEQRRNDLMTAHAVSYIALKEGLHRSQAHEDWHLLWKDDAGVVVITDPDMDWVRMTNANWPRIAEKKVGKVYCPVSQEQEADGIMYMPYPKGILEILKSARRRIGK